MSNQLTQKETMYLNEQKSHEQMCVQKYTSYAAQAQDPQLKQLFNSLASTEQQHYDTLNQMLSGQVPNMNQSQSQQQGANASAMLGSAMSNATTGLSGSSAQGSAMNSQSGSSTQGSAMGSQSGSSAQGSAMGSQSGSSAQGSAMSSQMGSSSAQGSQASGQSNFANSTDATLCRDMLMTEKYISGAYDTAIFEFANADMRQALNHIQSEEQQHGEQIFNYMQSNGMYDVQS